MRARRLLIAVVLVLGLGALVLFGTESERLDRSVFTDLPPPGMPFVPTVAGITTSWFCPGVPTSARRGGDVVVANPGSSPLRGRLTVFSTSDPVLVQDIQINARETTTYPLEDLAAGDYLSALVEIDGGIALVEQRSRHPNGRSMAPCSNSPSSNWYLADGITLGAGYDLVVTNPFPDYTNITVTVLTEDGVRTPTDLQNQTVAGRTVRKLDLEQFGLRDEQVLAVQVSSTPERVVVGRAQNYYGGLGRNGYAMNLGAPSADTRWYFGDGEKGSGVSESLTIFNPSESTASVTLQVFTEFIPGDEFVAVQNFDIAEGSVLKVDIDAIEGIPKGRHSLVVDSGDVPVVAEQVITRGSGGGAVTVVSLGSRVLARRWWVPTPLESVGEASLVVMNQTGEKGTVSVLALGPGGLLPVPGLQDLALVAANDFVGGVIDIDLTGFDLVGSPLVVESTVDAVVLRRPERGPNLKGRSSVSAVPEI